jgi:hypothetical protein
MTPPEILGFRSGGPKTSASGYPQPTPVLLCEVRLQRINTTADVLLMQPGPDAECYG